ncbi:dUTP pyrophosphatase [Sphaeroforma arctica JP610]|uniref:Deoxyuridine 5'-triphosphate nucleotidohydrolase n=1 Tax=Sphaeroforma arctica JP610 TaxID=667725 RepID=A0A0L0GAG4_9EUKA|nr:dUTP pyrophosphatase [Sphaeroforma arctica JP610]KNC85980.1 dUTP pyrophosphatase [Sphaeroforma arctica JP610]|eukprot:XP_014159882.1 dUTP pyrophosphatase [Sphaeroforma arctica JP610]
MYSRSRLIARMMSSSATKRTHIDGVISTTMSTMQVKKLSDDATIPVKGSALAAGFDLFSAHDGVIPAQGKAIMKTDISIAIPAGCYGRVAPRSGLSWKHHIDVGAGVIDGDYRGNVGVVLFNHAQTDYNVAKGDRVAQLILEKYVVAEIEEVQELDETVRGAGGFGSTGKN